MSDPKCARMMLDSAGKNLHALRVLTNDGPEESFGFHLQQAAEKALKAWIATLGGLYELTHDLGDLLSQIQDLGVGKAEVDRFRRLAGYTPYAVEYRYQGVDPWVEPIERGGAISLVGELLGHVQARLDLVLEE